MATHGRLPRPSPLLASLADIYIVTALLLLYGRVHNRGAFCKTTNSYDKLFLRYDKLPFLRYLNF